MHTNSLVCWGWEVGTGGRGRVRVGSGGSSWNEGGRRMFWVRKSKSATVATVTGVGEAAAEGLWAGPEDCCCWKKLSSSIEEILERGSPSSCMGSEVAPPGSSEELHTAVLKSKD